MTICCTSTCTGKCIVKRVPTVPWKQHMMSQCQRKIVSSSHCSVVRHCWNPGEAEDISTKYLIKSQITTSKYVCGKPGTNQAIHKGRVSIFLRFLCFNCDKISLSKQKYAILPLNPNKLVVLRNKQLKWAFVRWCPTISNSVSLASKW